MQEFVAIVFFGCHGNYINFLQPKLVEKSRKEFNFVVSASIPVFDARNVSGGGVSEINCYGVGNYGIHVTMETL